MIKKLLLIIMLFSLSITTSFANSVVDQTTTEDKQEYSLDYLRKIAQYHLDTFYSVDQTRQDNKLKAGKDYVGVYDVNEELIAYIIPVFEQKGNSEIGYVMVGSNNESPVILEACIDETLYHNIQKKNLKNKKLVYLAPLKLGYIESKSNDYKDIRTDEVIDISKNKKVTDMNENKESLSEIKQKNKEKWIKTNNLLKSQVEEDATDIMAVADYVDPTVYEISNEQDFVKIYVGTDEYTSSDNDNWDNPDDDCAYGGDQVL